MPPKLVPDNQSQKSTTADSCVWQQTQTGNASKSAVPEGNDQYAPQGSQRVTARCSLHIIIWNPRGLQESEHESFSKVHVTQVQTAYLLPASPKQFPECLMPLKFLSSASQQSASRQIVCVCLGLRVSVCYCKTPQGRSASLHMSRKDVEEESWKETDLCLPCIWKIKMTVTENQKYSLLYEWLSLYSVLLA